MVWLRNDPQRQRDFAHRLETDLHDAGYYLPRREPRLLRPVQIAATLRYTAGLRRGFETRDLKEAKALLDAL